ncbi:MAG TPA: NYN domain-containing protein [Streptosporangiaceae bacterium]
MDRCALFVDAGYVLADGAMAAQGTNHRESVSWDYAGLLQYLAGVATDRTGLQLLRCYWYEATVDGRRTPEHDTLADLPGLLLRLGRMRPGKREGVETEMHRDLTTLARNRAVSDVLLISAEEDLAPVIADVQDLGLRVILVHISVDGNWTVSRSLRQQCDAIVEINGAQLRPFTGLAGGSDPVRYGEQYAAVYGGGQLSNGHAAGAAAGSHQLFSPGSTGSHPAPPAIYTAPVVAEYQPPAPPQLPGRQPQPEPRPAVDGAQPAEPTPRGLHESPAAPVTQGPPSVNSGPQPLLGQPGQPAQIQQPPQSLQGQFQPGQSQPGQALPGQPQPLPPQPLPGQPLYPPLSPASFREPASLAQPPVAPQPPAAPEVPAAQGPQAPVAPAPAPPVPPSTSGQRAAPQSPYEPSGQGTFADAGPQFPPAPAEQFSPAPAEQFSPAPAEQFSSAPTGLPTRRGTQGQTQGQTAQGPALQPQRAPLPSRPPQAARSPAQRPVPTAPASYVSPQAPYNPAPAPAPGQPAAPAATDTPVTDTVQAAHAEGFEFGESVAREAPALWLEAVLARKPRMPTDLEARLLQGSVLPIDSLLHDEVRHALRQGFWDALERSRR